MAETMVWTYPRRQVIEVVEYLDDDFDGPDEDYEIVSEIVEQVVMVPHFSAVPAYEVGIGAAPALFMAPEEKASFWAQLLLAQQAGIPTTGTSAATTAGSSPAQRVSTVKQPTQRLSTRRHLSIINQALALPEDSGLDDYEEEEIIEEEEILEEEYDDEEVIEEEYYDEEEYEEYEYEEEIVETPEETKAREQLEWEIAEIERQITEAKKKKEERMAEEGPECEEETSAEKAVRMANESKMEDVKRQKKQLTFKQKAAARAKALEEKEKNWGKKGKKKQKDLSEIIAQKAKKQKKLLSRQKSKDGTNKSKTPSMDAEKRRKELAAKAAEEEAAKAPAPEKKQLSMAEMLAAKMDKGKDGAHAAKAKPSEEAKVDVDDFGDEDLKAEDFLPSSSDEEEEEEEPELTPEEQHKKSLEWSKPTWTQAKLKTTTKGNKIKAGKTLSAPITFIPKKINEGLEEDDEDDGLPSKGALMKGAMKMVVLPKAKKHQAGLKFTGNGARIRDGRKIEKQINPKSNKDKEEVTIWGADPDELKLTPRGLKSRKGKTLSDDITMATQKKKYQFEKPQWAQFKKEQLLKATEVGEVLKEGEDIAPKISQATQEKKYQFEKPTWTKAQLKNTESGEKVKSGAYLSAPIVQLDKKTMNVNMEANPAFLRMTDQGERLMEDGTLETPITAAPELAKQRRKK